MPLFSKTTARQKEIRRSKAERQATWYRRVYASLRLGPLTLLTACAVAAALAVNMGQDVLGLQAGQWLPREIPCRFTFRVENAERTRSERFHARNNAPACYTLNTSLVENIKNRLNSLLTNAREHVAEPEKLRELAAKDNITLDDNAVTELLRLAQGADLEASHFQNAVERATQALERQPLVQATDLVQRRAGARAELVDPAQSTRRSVPGENLLFSNNREHVLKAVQAAAGVFATPLRPSIEQSLQDLLATETPESFKPLYRYDPAQTARTAQEAEELVPVQYDEFPVGQPLADEGELTDAELRNLQEEHRRYLLLLERLGMPQFADIPGSEVGKDQPVTIFESGEPAAVFQDIRRTREFEDRRVLAMFSGAGDLESFKQDRKLATWTRRARLALVFLMVFALGGYMLVEHESVLGRTRRRLVTALTLLLALIVARQAYLYTSFPHLAVGVGAFTAMLLVVAAGRGMAYAGASLLAVLLALATGQGVEFVIILVAVCLVLLVGLRNLRHRGQIIATGSLAAAVAALTTQFAGLLDGQPAAFVFWHNTVWAGLSTLAAAFIVEGILPALERLFGVTTNMTLLEWCDPNKPLLRMLAAESAGTYNHSLLVGALADAAADAIGANGLLARAGAYYHDIGKINKPEYFVENQSLGVGNRHERLSPAMSHLIIIGHVKDGIEMAKAYGVPTTLHAFIPEHHGTCVVEYFYHAASQARRPGDPEVSDTQFRYPGPKPQSRETAIVMMCDAVEGAVRAMPEPTPNRVEDTVDRMVEKRLVDGQFDECPLTFRELAAIRGSLVKSLISIYHGRIKYPSDEKKEAEARSVS